MEMGSDSHALSLSATLSATSQAAPAPPAKLKYEGRWGAVLHRKGVAHWASKFKKTKMVGARTPQSHHARAYARACARRAVIAEVSKEISHRRPVWVCFLTASH